MIALSLSKNLIFSSLNLTIHLFFEMYSNIDVFRVFIRNGERWSLSYMNWYLMARRPWTRNVRHFLREFDIVLLSLRRSKTEFRSSCLINKSRRFVSSRTGISVSCCLKELSLADILPNLRSTQSLVMNFSHVVICSWTRLIVNSILWSTLN